LVIRMNTAGIAARSAHSARFRPQSSSPARVEAISWSLAVPARLMWRVRAAREVAVTTAHAAAAAPIVQARAQPRLPGIPAGPDCSPVIHRVT
jgi:hypothetical protein